MGELSSNISYIILSISGLNAPIKKQIGRVDKNTQWPSHPHSLQETHLKYNTLKGIMLSERNLKV